MTALKRQLLRQLKNDSLRDSSKMADDDEDVVIAGSALHRHLLENGHGDLELTSPGSDRSFSSELPGPNSSSKDSCLIINNNNDANPVDLSTRKRLTSVVWPDSCNKFLEVELAQEIVKSELLVSEDEDFINNFVLSEEVLEEYRKTGEGGGSVLGDVLLFSGSLAAVAGAVFFFSERTRLATTAAAVLPSALATVTSLRLGARVQQRRESKEFEELVKQMLGDMKIFKQLLRKSLNLIQGMEMMNQGYMYAVNQNRPVENGDVKPSQYEESQLSKALCKRSSFIALRRAIYSSTLQITKAYREAIQTLMEVCPLAEHIDLKDHYLAFIELENFGIEHNLPDERLSVRQLKDTIQLALLQQSEYLRRFSLSFCEKALRYCDKKVREDEKLQKAGVLKHVKEIISKLRTVSDKLGNILEYHQALGLVPLPELEQRALNMRKQQGLQQVKRLLPLKTVYTSLFSTGLHLQNSLLKVRHLEGFFDTMEKQKTESENKLIPDEAQLLDWLGNFKEIQTELNACLTCLDDGVNEIDSLGRPGSSRSCTSSSRCESSDLSASSPISATEDFQDKAKVIDEKTEIAHMDEVFEAFIASHDYDPETLGFDDDFVAKEDVEKNKASKKQSKKVLNELKTVLVGKQREWEVREARAIARQAKVDIVDGRDEAQNENENEDNLNGHDEKIIEDIEPNRFSLQLPKSLYQSNILGLSQETDSDAESIRSDTNTIKSPNTESRDDELNNVHWTGSNGDFTPLTSKLSNRLSSSEDDSHCSDSELEKSHRACLPRVGGLTNMSSSCWDSRKGSRGEEDLKERRRRTCLRSLSTPNIKRDICDEVASPYVSLEKLLDQDEDEINQSSSNSSSHEMLGKDQLFKRPSRATALRRGNMKAYTNASTAESIQSVYMSKQTEEVRVNQQPDGWDSRLAAAAVARSREFRGEIGGDIFEGGDQHFGDSDSDLSSSSSEGADF